MATKREATDEGSTAPTTKKLRSSFTCGDVVTVKVGESPVETFTVHKDLICASSSFFRAATSGQWKESTDQSITLQEAVPYAFRVYLEWLYDPSGDILETVYALCSIRKESAKTQRQDEAYHLVRTWILGDFLGDCSFTNGVMKRLLQLEINRGSMFRDSTVKMILKDCPRGSVLYKWLVDTCCAVFGTSFIDQCKDFASNEFWLDMLKAYMTAPRSTISKHLLPTIEQLSEYEQHDVNSKMEEGENEVVKKEDSDQDGDTKKEGGKSNEEAHT